MVKSLRKRLAGITYPAGCAGVRCSTRQGQQLLPSSPPLGMTLHNCVSLAHASLCQPSTPLVTIKTWSPFECTRRVNA